MIEAPYVDVAGVVRPPLFGALAADERCRCGRIYRTNLSAENMDNIRYSVACDYCAKSIAMVFSLNDIHDMFGYIARALYAMRYVEFHVLSPDEIQKRVEAAKAAGETWPPEVE